MTTTGFVLAGGLSSRMGRDKARVLLAGQPLIAHAVAKLRRVCPEVFILSSDASLAEFAPILPDLHPACGPLGGMETALTHTRTEWNLFLPVDVPFIPPAFLQHLLANAQPPAKIVVARAEGRPQPTVAVLHRDLLPLLSQSIAEGQFKLRPALQRAAQTLTPSIAAFQFLDAPAGMAFANLNTPEDLVLAETNALSCIPPLVPTSNNRNRLQSCALACQGRNRGSPSF